MRLFVQNPSGPNTYVPPTLHPGPPPSQKKGNHTTYGGDKDEKKEKKRLGQACGACRRRKV